jgi:O-antigen ligase
MTIAGRLASWLPTALLVFVAAAFVLPNGPSYALVFYIAVLPCLGARLAVGLRPDLRDHLRDFGAALALALVVFSGLTLLWGQDDGHRSWRFAGDTAATSGFVLAMLAVLDKPWVRAALARVLVMAGAANAVFSIAVFVITHPVFPRLTGWGATTHPILGAAVMAVAGLTALARALVPAAPRSQRAGNLAAALVMAAFILMTESRGPLLAASIGVVFLCAASVWRVRAFAGLAVLAGAWFSLPRAARQHGAAVLVERGSSHRFEVWDYTLGLIRDRPLFGHGLAANLHLVVSNGVVSNGVVSSGVVSNGVVSNGVVSNGVVNGARKDAITFPHDLYLSLLFYSGVVGLLIFSAMAALLTWRLLRAAKRADAEWAWLSALWLNVLVVGLTDLGQITKGPGPIWFIVWLPVGLLLTRKEELLFEKRSKNF